MSVAVRHFGIDLLPEAVAEMDALPDRVRAEALDALYKVVRGKVRGHLLGARPEQRLEACRRLYLGEARWRVVYLEMPKVPGAVGTRGVLVVAAGPKAGGAVYATAANRLHALRAAFASNPETAPSATNPTAPAARMRPGPPNQGSIPPDPTRRVSLQAALSPQSPTWATDVRAR